MIATSPRSLFLVTLLALSTACATERAPLRRAESVPRASPAAPEPSEVGGLHIVAEGAHFGDGVSLRPCPVDGRMFICGTSLEFRDGRFLDAGLPIPPNGAVGRLPDDGWSLSRDREGGELRRWDPALRRWDKVGFKLRASPEDPALRQVLLRWWSEATVLVVDQGSDVGLELTVWGNGQVRPAPSFVLEDGSRVLDEVDEVSTFETGELLMVGTSGEEVPLTRAVTWASQSARPIVQTLGDGECRVNDLFSVSPEDVVAVGARGASACAFRFDGSRWSPLDVPSGYGEALSYARGPALKEWLILRRRNGTFTAGSLALWSRQVGQDWEQVRFAEPVPVSRGVAPRRTDARLYVLGDEAPWLHVDYDYCGARVLALLTAQPAPKVCWLFGAGESCREVDAYPPREWDWTSKACGP